MKICKDCQQQKELTAFYYNKKKDLYETSCKVCRAKRKRLYISSSPKEYIKNLVHQSKNRSRAGLFFSITPDEVYEIYQKQKGKCAISNITMSYVKDGKGDLINNYKNISIDRIDNAKPYSIENVQLICVALNFWKRNLSNEDFCLVLDLFYRGMCGDTSAGDRHPMRFFKHSHLIKKN